MSKRIVISGYYGFGNIGDEAVLDGIVASLQLAGLDAEVTVLSADPARTRREHAGVGAVHSRRILQVARALRQTDLVISGGGSLLQDVTSSRSTRYYLAIIQYARFLRRKTMIYAQGVGPLSRPGIRRAVMRVLNRVDLITVRDEDSMRLLQSIGVHRPPISLVADPSFMVEPDLSSADRALAASGAGGEHLMAVSLRPWPAPEGWAQEAARGISKACRDLGVKPVAIPMQLEQDESVCRLIDGALMTDHAGEVRTVKGIIARCGLAVGMRLHSLMFAASQGVPFVPMVYDPKVSSFAALMDQPAGIRLEDLTADDLARAITSAWNDREALASRLMEHVPRLRGMAQESAELAAGLLNKADKEQ